MGPWKARWRTWRHPELPGWDGILEALSDSTGLTAIPSVWKADSLGRSKWWGPAGPLISIDLRSKRRFLRNHLWPRRVLCAHFQRTMDMEEALKARWNLEQLQMHLTLSRCIDSLKKGAIPVSWQLAGIVEIGRVRLPVVTGKWQSMKRGCQVSQRGPISKDQQDQHGISTAVIFPVQLWLWQLCSMQPAQCPACGISKAGWLKCHFRFLSVQGLGGFGYGVLRLERIEGHVARSKGDTVASCDEQLWRKETLKSLNLDCWVNCHTLDTNQLFLVPILFLKQPCANAKQPCANASPSFAKLRHASPKEPL